MSTDAELERLLKDEAAAKDALIRAAMRFALSIKNNAMLVSNWGDGEGGYALQVVRQAMIDVGVFEPRGTPKKHHRKPVPHKVRKAVFERDAYRCVCCGTHLDLTLDHKIPVSKGGDNTMENLQAMCMPCNNRKGVEVMP